MNWWRFFIALVYFVAENQYFGWHYHAQSDAEMLADGIVLLIVALSYPTSQEHSDE